MQTHVRQADCPACGYQIAAPFYHGGDQPLATIAWPASVAQALDMPRLPLDFVRCVDCGHVYNASFDYRAVPYSDKPNLMFNRGQIWARYIEELQSDLSKSLPPNPVVVEIGYGDGTFLQALAKRKPGRYIGFDPNGARAEEGNGLSFRKELFEPTNHLAELRPDLIVSRHVLEHLTNPLAFLQTINYVAGSMRLPTRMYFEVPCVDRAIETLRTVDFYYEHNSQFTSESFRRMLERSGGDIERIGYGYSGEVIHGLLRAAGQPRHHRIVSEATQFLSAAEAARSTIGMQLVSLHLAGKAIAIWGGTGKSAAFMQRYGVDRSRFPVVVDSDANKAGTFVPGTGQEIVYRNYLLDHPAEVLVIPPQWRAADIVREIQSAGIRYETILIEHEGRLVDFERGVHPYGASQDHGRAGSCRPETVGVNGDYRS